MRNDDHDDHNDQHALLGDHSDTDRRDGDDEQQLLDRSERDDGHTTTASSDSWTMEIDDGSPEPRPSFSWRSAAWRLPMLLICFGFLFVVFKALMIVVINRGAQELERGDIMFKNGTHIFGPTAIVISLDGFRTEYLYRNVTPNIAQLASYGIRAKYMHPSFPSITFPNHWTLATGLYPESHGIVANEFYDPALQKEFRYDLPEAADPHWWHGEPIWKTATRQKKRSAVSMWPGSSVKGLEPDYVVHYDASQTPLQKMEQVIQWIDLPDEERPNLIMSYIPQSDTEGHATGPTGLKINDTLQQIDEAIGYLMDKLQERDILGYVHIVIVSDHGMTETNASRIVYYDDILSKQSMSWLATREGSPLLNLRPKPDAPKHAVTQIYQELHNYTQTQEAHFEVYLRKDVPDRFHYNSSERIAPIVVIPEVGYMLLRHEDWKPKSANEEYPLHGIHGYDNLAQDMRAIFIATGPIVDFNYGEHGLLAPFFNTEVYSFICRLINVRPAPHNGTLEGRFFRIA